jgi:hypothetical protein
MTMMNETLIVTTERDQDQGHHHTHEEVVTEIEIVTEANQDDIDNLALFSICLLLTTGLTKFKIQGCKRETDAMIREPSSTEDISTAFSVENKILKRKIEKLHRENIQLKKSLFEINIRYLSIHQIYSQI